MILPFFFLLLLLFGSGFFLFCFCLFFSPIHTCNCYFCKQDSLELDEKVNKQNGDSNI